MYIFLFQLSFGLGKKGIREKEGGKGKKGWGKGREKRAEGREKGQEGREKGEKRRKKLNVFKYQKCLKNRGP